MKILQLNIWGGKLGKQIIELIQEEQPDVICLQEAISFPTIENFFMSPLEEIMPKTGYEHLFFSPSFAFNLMKRKAHWGNAILSHAPQMYQYSEFTRGEFTEDFDILDGDYNMRNLQHVIVDHNGAKLHILNHHGHHINQHKLGDEETVRQCTLIKEYIEKLDGPVVLCGDFNLAPQSESLGLLSGVLDNHCVLNNITTTRTQLTHKTEVCDYIFTTPGLVVSDFMVHNDIASDHAALSIVIQ